MWVPDTFETQKLYDARRACLARERELEDEEFQKATKVIDQKKQDCVEFIKRSYAEAGVLPEMPIQCETYLKKPNFSRILARLQAHYGSTAEFKSLSGHPFQESWGNVEDYCGCETVIQPAIQVTIKHL